MPTVPFRQQPSVQSRALPTQGFSVRAQQGDFGGDIGQGLGEAANVAGQMAARERDRQNSVRVMEAERRLNEWETERLYGEDGALQKKGRNAIGVEADVMAEYESQIAEIEQDLGNPEQREVFRKLAFRRIEDARRTTLRHEREQIEAYAEAETQAFLETSRNAAAMNYTDPERIRREIGRQQAILRSQGLRNGLPAEVVDQNVSLAASGTHSAVLNRMLANDQYRQAKAYLDENRSEMVGEHLLKAEQAVEQGSIRAEGQDATDRILSETDDRSDALKQARSIDDPQVRDETVNRINRRFDEAEAVQREADRERMQGALNTVEETGDTAQIPADQWAELTVTQRNALEQRARRVRQGIEPTTDWDRYYKLTRMATDPERQREFVNEDLLQYRDKLADSEFKELVGMQDSIRAKRGVPEGDWIRNKNQMVDDAIRAMGYEPTEKDEDDAAVVRTFRTRVQEDLSLFEQQHERKPTPQEFQQIVDRLMLEGETRGTFVDPDRRFFQVEEGAEFFIDDIPGDERRKIEGALRRANKRVTDEAVIQLYTRNKTRPVRVR